MGMSATGRRLQTLCLVEKAPEINLDRLDETTDEVELLYREIIRKLDGMRMERGDRPASFPGRDDGLLYHVGTSD